MIGGGAWGHEEEREREEAREWGERGRCLGSLGEEREREEAREWGERGRRDWGQRGNEWVCGVQLFTGADLESAFATCIGYKPKDLLSFILEYIKDKMVEPLLECFIFLLLNRYDIKLNNAILAEDKHVPMYEQMASKYSVKYITGWATQNAIRVAQWMLQTPGATRFMGCIGKDKFGEEMKRASTAAGVNAS
ncbi:uncharacterized protein A4U43_C04F1410 [Asparagus officinalis]|uniref:Adenosine kinase n=1 Tax=Asparagus officinalis TaxID=4686 RepID=A0A5P1EXI2_ASPOF|nr:uncharacterized protein A4U43_C04F1410 [Asparagus officinalis]